MLRLPKFELQKPTTVAEAVECLAQEGEAIVIAGGTDLVPNMKHELFTPERVVSLGAIKDLVGIRSCEKGLRIGAMTPLSDVANSDLVQCSAPALAQAAGLVAGPQLRRMGTLGGNVLLDTRCQWYNQTYFWREALGFCLKKDGELCHVVEGGQKCVAAASNDTVPPLMTVNAQLVIAGPESSGGERKVDINEFWLADGIYNKRLEKGELLTHIEIPNTSIAPNTNSSNGAESPTGPAEHRGAYGKLRTRGSIDFPLLGCAVRIDLDSDGLITDADLVFTALQAKPVRIKKAAELLRGLTPSGQAFEDAVAQVAQRAYKQCHPMPNIPGDHEYRREMVPVYAKRTLMAAAERNGPVHHI